MNHIIHSKLNMFRSLPASKRLEVIFLTTIGSAFLAGILPLARNLNEYLFLWFAMFVPSFLVATEETYGDYPEERMKMYANDQRLITRKYQPSIERRLPPNARDEPVTGFSFTFFHPHA